MTRDDNMSAFNNAMQQLDLAAEKLNLDEKVVAKLKQPNHVHEFDVVGLFDVQLESEYVLSSDPLHVASLV